LPVRGTTRRAVGALPNGDPSRSKRERAKAIRKDQQKKGEKADTNRKGISGSECGVSDMMGRHPPVPVPVEAETGMGDVWEDCCAVGSKSRIQGCWRKTLREKRGEGGKRIEVGAVDLLGGG